MASCTMFVTAYGGSVVTENPKGELAGNFGRIRRRTTQICLENENMGVGAQNSSKLLGGSL